MAGIEFFIFGYRRLTAEEAMRPRLVNAFLTLGISAVGDADGAFVIRESDYKALSAYSGGRVRFTASDLLGLPSYLLGLRSHIAVLVTAVLCAVAVILMSGVVWDIRAASDSSLTDSEVREMLEEVGFGVGTVWSGADLADIENKLLLNSPELAFAHINRRGTVAYVLVKEKEGYRLPEDTAYRASNIVASCDGVIEEITVSEGRAAVAVGDSVRKGDILISGIVDTEGGSYLVRAEGTVRARVTGTAEATASITEERKITEVEGLSELSVSLFGFSLNIFKNYGNLDEGCVIIENEEECLLFDKYRLPVTVRRGYTSSVSTVTDTHSESELPLLAKERLDEILREVLADRDLIKLRTAGEFTDGGYILRADYVYTADISSEVGIDLPQMP